MANDIGSFCVLLKRYTRTCTKVSNLSKRKNLLQSLVKPPRLEKLVGDDDFYLQFQNYQKLIPKITQELKDESRKAKELFEQILEFVKK